jgi:hypothetical protein
MLDTSPHTLVTCPVDMTEQSSCGAMTLIVDRFSKRPKVPVLPGLVRTCHAGDNQNAEGAVYEVVDL